MIDFFEFFADIGQLIYDFIFNIDSYFMSLFVWLQKWYIKMKLTTSIMFIKISYFVAVGLLDEIGFNSLLSELFNKLPSELRFYAFSFKVPEGISIWMNCATTSLVMRFSK